MVSSGASTVLRVPPGMCGACASQKETQRVLASPGKVTWLGLGLGLGRVGVRVRVRGRVRVRVK